MRTLYPDIEPFHHQLLAREEISAGRRHEVYFEQCGNPHGIPVIFLHGGPGSGCRSQHRCYFDPERYHIILFDQRGCGRSLPSGELEHNTTDYLISDMEAIRTLLNIDKWMLFGGSWGATLAMAYARQHAQHVSNMVLRGTFLGRQQDIDWVYAAGGASRVFAEAWHALVKDLPSTEQPRPLAYYYQQLTQTTEQQQQIAANTLQNWEGTIVMLRDQHYQPDAEQSSGPLAHSRIQLHYALNNCFLGDIPLLDSIKQINHIPVVIIHGRYDMVCPMQQSWEVYQRWPDAQFEILPLAGHAASEPAIIDALVRATDQLATQLT
ncbi:prolyl aminopeptidase [Methylophaga sp.]|uniref:prolyl aminopeptidase n=1 Tax=Methylophaga sp. TaxID=2024840 RepID=UPI00271EBE24|nr:prolyl aminopeptidase [Methylophaga sp.]MDO8827415.1 prolyl aminopeptidase [Methylophaga sp.]